MTTHPFDPAVEVTDGRAELRIEQTWETDVADLWDAVSDPERLARWFAPILGTPCVGGEFGIQFDDGDVPGMTLLYCERGRAFTFVWPMEAGPTEVHVEVRAVTPTTSTLVLTHRLLSTSQGARVRRRVGGVRRTAARPPGGTRGRRLVGGVRRLAGSPPRAARRMTRDYPEMIGSAVSRALSKASSTATRVRWAYGARARSSETATEAR